MQYIVIIDICSFATYNNKSYSYSYAALQLVENITSKTELRFNLQFKFIFYPCLVT